MNYGPELIEALVPFLKKYRELPVIKIEGGADWCTLTFKTLGSLFFTWNPETFGICSVTGDQQREFRTVSSKTPFVMALQRHMGGGSLTDVESVPGDRILKLKFRRFLGGGVSREFTLILECMGRFSNALFLDEDGCILECAKHIYPEVNRYRSVLPGGSYTPPPPIDGVRGYKDMTDDGLEEFLKCPVGLGRILNKELSRLWKAGYTEMVRDALFGDEVIFQTIGGKYLTALGILLPGAERGDDDGLKFCRCYIADSIERRGLKNIASRAMAVIERQTGGRMRHIDGLRNQIEKGKTCDKYRVAGEAILQNLHRTDVHGGDVEFEYWDENGLQKTVVHLDPALDLQGNSKKYFKKFRKYRTDIPGVERKLEELLEELEDLRALENNLKRVDSAERLVELCDQVTSQYDSSKKKKTKNPNRKTKKPLPPHLRFDCGSSIILVGMNEKGNRYVTFRAATPEDLWFHVHEVPGSHVILRNPPENAEACERLIRAAASLALCYSESSDESSVIDYTPKKHVRHIGGAGPANVTYKFPETVSVTRDEWKDILKK